MRVLNDALSEAQAGATSFDSTAIEVGHIAFAALQAQWTGTVAGTLQVQASCDPAAPTNWNDLSGKSLTPSGSAGSGLVELANMGYRWLRVTWTRTGGSGAITLRLNGKGA